MRRPRTPPGATARLQLRRLRCLGAGLRGSRRAALLQDVRELAVRRREEPDQSGQSALDRADELRPERLARRQVGKRLELGRRQHLPLDVAGLDGQRLVRPRERVQRLRDRDRILLREDDRRGALEVRAEPFERGRLDRDPRQPVLHDLVLRRHRAQLLAQLAELLDGEAAVLREHHGLHAVQPCLQLFDRRDFLLRRHPQTAFLKRLATAWASTGTPGPIVVDKVSDLRYVPFAAAGFARTIASMSAIPLAASCAAPNECLPIGVCTLPALSTRNSTLPALASRTARPTSKVTVPSFGFGMSPRGPSTLPSRPTWPMRSGVAMAESNSSQPPCTRSTRSSAPTTSAPASRASRSLSPLAKTATRTLLPMPLGSTTAPRTI